MTASDRAYDRLDERFAAAGRLGSASKILFWDSQAYMPPGGAWARGEQLAAIESVRNGMIVAPDAAELFDRAEEERAALDPVERSNLSEMRRLWRHDAAVPADLMMERTRQIAAIQPIWVEAKKTNDFDLFARPFAPLLDLYRETAQAKADALALDPYDALMDELDPGLSTAIVDPVFDDLARNLPALLSEAIDRQAGWPAAIPFAGDFSVERQRALSDKLAVAVGHDPRHLRIDAAPHPFSVTGVPGDLRVTTRFDTDDVRFAIMGTLHEAGHALYEAGLPITQAFRPVGTARGATAHESQSLMVEMQAARSREFLSWLAPQMAEAFGGDPACWMVANVLNIYRRVGEGFIRVEADEISYPLHIILRYRIERALLSGDLQVGDIPGAWADLSQALFGRTPPDHARGCLQDIHWAAGLFGYFPNYALGASLAAQLFERAVADDPAMLGSLSQGDFGPYRQWVTPRIHERASTVPFATLVEEATGAPLSGAALTRHLRRRYIDETAP